MLETTTGRFEELSELVLSVPPAILIIAVLVLALIIGRLLQHTLKIVIAAVLILLVAFFLLPGVQPIIKASAKQKTATGTLKCIWAGAGDRSVLLGNTKPTTLVVCRPPIETGTDGAQQP